MQLSLFSGNEPFAITKPIRLIELFAGYGSQALALKYLRKDYQHWKACEWAVKSIQAYKDIHFKEDNNDYSKGLSKEELIKYLHNKGISSNYNEPMKLEQIKKLGEPKLRQIYNNIMATNNLVNIQQVKGEDLEIVDTEKYCYIMTYSFPCQDLSSAGLGKGMQKGLGTRSGMLWEVERILDEISHGGGQMPQVLLMENVPEVVGKKNMPHFAKWLEKLESLGYKCYWEILNAKDFGIPQNRERCFMISILGDYYYEFPSIEPLKLKLKDMLEKNVDEKYYLSDRALKGAINTKFNCSKLENKLPKNGIVPTICARDYKDPKCVKIQGKDYEITKDCDNYIQWHQEGFLDMETRAWKDDKVAPTLHTACGKTKVLENQNLKKKLCNDLIVNQKVKENDVIRHSYSTSRMNGDKKDIQTNNMCPTLDTRCDCLGVVVKDELSLKYVDRKLLETIKNNNGEIPEFADLYNSRPINNGIAGTLSTSCGNDCGCGSFSYIENFRIRKLTPKECFRLMGVADDDFDKVSKSQSNASLYHLAGDSIVVNGHI